MSVLLKRHVFVTGYDTVLSVLSINTRLLTTRGYWQNTAVNGCLAHVRSCSFSRFVINTRSVYTLILLDVYALFCSFIKLLTFPRIVKNTVRKTVNLTPFYWEKRSNLKELAFSRVLQSEWKWHGLSDFSAFPRKVTILRKTDNFSAFPRKVTNLQKYNLLEYSAFSSKSDRNRENR